MRANQRVRLYMRPCDGLPFFGPHVRPGVEAEFIAPRLFWRNQSTAHGRASTGIRSSRRGRDPAAAVGDDRLSVARLQLGSVAARLEPTAPGVRRSELVELIALVGLTESYRSTSDGRPKLFGKRRLRVEEEGELGRSLRPRSSSTCSAQARSRRPSAGCVLDVSGHAVGATVADEMRLASASRSLPVRPPPR